MVNTYTRYTRALKLNASFVNITSYWRVNVKETNIIRIKMNFKNVISSKIRKGCFSNDIVFTVGGKLFK